MTTGAKTHCEVPVSAKRARTVLLMGRLKALLVKVVTTKLDCTATVWLPLKVAVLKGNAAGAGEPPNTVGAVTSNMLGANG